MVRIGLTEKMMYDKEGERVSYADIWGRNFYSRGNKICIDLKARV